MQVPVEIAYQGLERSEALDQRIREEVDKLETFHPRLTSCRVVVTAPHRRHHQGNLYTVRVHLEAPGGVDLTVNRNPSAKHAHEDPYVAVRDAFMAARRRLQDRSRKQQGKVKSHETAPHGKIARLFKEEGYGFIAAADGREVYFHRHAVADDQFSKLSPGDEVRFEEAEGDQGPQATLVRAIGKHHLVE